MSDIEMTAAQRAMRNSEPELDLSGGPTGSVKLPLPIGERQMIFIRPYVEDANLEECINTIGRLRTKNKQTNADLVEIRKAARKAVKMILDLSDEHIDMISHENTLGIIAHYRIRSNQETMSPLLGAEDES